jgi:glycosyltransferase involved in cell wall biosynthesis
MAGEDDRIVVINKPNGGLPSARNASLDVVRGQYVQTLDGDDWLEPTACEEMYRYAVEHDLDVVVVDYYNDDDHGYMTHEVVFHNSDKILTSGEALKKTFVESDSGMLCNRFVRRKLYDGLRLPEQISYGEDIVTSARLAIRSKRTGKYNKAFYHYIYNPESITKDSVGKKMHQYFEGFEIIREYLEQANILENQESNLEVLEFNKIAFFLFQKSYPEDEGYQKSLNMALDYLGKHKKIPQQVSRVRRVFLSVLTCCPQKRVFCILSKVARLIRKIKG